MDLQAMKQAVVAALEDIKAKDIMVLDVAALTSMTECMIIASADSNGRRARSANVQDKLREAERTALGVEGGKERRVGTDRFRPGARAYHATGGTRILQPGRIVGRAAPVRRQIQRDGAGRLTVAGMRLLIVAVGHKMPEWVTAGFAEYVKRMPREARIELLEIKPEKRGGGKSGEQVKEAERTRILAALPKGCELVALDEHGDQTTLQLAQTLKDWLGGGRDVAW
jgi:hypothetical protein